jgi:hypothetical protein
VVTQAFCYIKVKRSLKQKQGNNIMVLVAEAFREAEIKRDEREADREKKEQAKRTPEAVQELVYGGDDTSEPTYETVYSTESAPAEPSLEQEPVAEGPITFEQYMAKRPVRKEGDLGFISDKAIDDALKSVEIKTEADSVAKFQKFNRDIAEGELLVEASPRLKGLYALGIEMLALSNSDPESDEYETSVQPLLEAKKAMYDDLTDYYQEKGIDNRALEYVHEKTVMLVDDPEYVSNVGAPHFEGEKITILEVVENADEDLKAYTIEKADGSIEAVYAKDVWFKLEENQALQEAQPEEQSLEAEKPEEQSSESNQLEAEPELSRFEKVKQFFGKERQKVQEYGGLSYMGGLWSQADNWLSSRHITETMTEEEVQEQKYVNRRNVLMGLAATVAAVYVARNLGVYIDGLDGSSSTTMLTDPSNMSGTEGSGAIETHGSIASMENAVPEAPAPSFFDSGADVQTPTIDNAVYDIPSGTGGLDLFSNAGLNADSWYDNAQSLADKFPNDFNRVGSDVRIAHSGWLSPEARAYIESLKTN